MVKDEINVVVNNLKLSIFNSRISLSIIERFSILIIDNKYAKSIFILQSSLTVSVGNIDIFSHFFY